MYINNCDDVLLYLYSKYENPDDDYVFFQGDKCKVGGLSPRDLGVLCLHPDFPGYIFLIGIVYNGLFPVFIFKNGDTMDQSLGILLPAYVRDEMIATATGKW